MVKSLAQIQKQIEALQRQAEVIRTKEAKDVIARIREAIKHYGLTDEDLFPKDARRGRKPAASKRTGSTPKRQIVKPKYRDENGNTWSGRGRQPRWLAAAVAEGRSAEEFLIHKS